MKFDLEMWDRVDWPRPDMPPSRVVSHNLFHDNASRHTPGDHAIHADPRFVAVPQTIEADGDFQLRDDSPARDAGIDTGLRCFADTPKDIGAYEHGQPPWTAGLLNRASE